MAFTIDAKEQQRRHKRANRFENHLSGKRKGGGRGGGQSSGIDYSLWSASENTGEGIDFSTFQIVGTSQNLEKKYLRLTSAPDPATVRPEQVLRQSLQMLRGKWQSGETRDYRYMLDNFKAIRQDLSVQHIRNELTVQVYETHAKIAMEIGDLAQFSPCVTQLISLYGEKPEFRANFYEFECYRILYAVLINNQAQLNKMLSSMASGTRQQTDVAYCLQIAAALSQKNYHRFFKLRAQGEPYSTRFLLDQIQPRVRFEGLQTLCKAYRPSKLPMQFVCTGRRESSFANLIVFECSRGCSQTSLISQRSASLTALKGWSM